MADDATSVGKIQLDIEISKSSLGKELGGLNKAFGNSFKSTFIGIGGQMTGFMKTTIGKMVGGFKQVGQEGANANKRIAQSTDDMTSKVENLVHQQESATNRAEMHRQKLLELQAQYDRLSKAGLGESDKGKKLRDQVTMAEDKVNRYGAASDRTRAKIDQLEQSMANLGSTANKTTGGFNKADDGTKKTGRSLKILGNQVDKSSGKIGAFSNTLTRSFMQVLKRVFILGLIYKAIRGLMNYMNSSLKTNKEFTNSLNQIGTNLKVAFQPIYDYILPALNALMRGIATVTAYIAAAISALFGKSYKQSFGAAKGIESAKKAMDGYGKSAKKAKESLAGFDEINQLDISDEEGSGGGGAAEYEMEMPDTSTIDLSGLDRFKELLQPTIDSLKNLGLALEPLKNFVSQGLQDFYNNFLVPVGQWTFGEGLPRFIDAITKGLMGISWETINASLNGLWLALTPFAINVGEGLLWLWENVLVPLGTWTMNEIVPRFLDILAEVIKVLTVTIVALKPLGLWLWDNFLQPLAKWTGGVIVSVLDGLILALQGIGDWISNNQKKVENMAIAIGSFMTTWIIVDLATKIWGIVTALTTFITTGGLATLVTTGLAAAIAFLTHPITIAIAIIGALIAVGVLLYKNWDEISVWLKEVWEGIKIKAVEIWTAIKDYFVNTWESIKTTATNVWNGIKDYTVTKWNEIKDFLSKLWEGIKESFSKVWEAMKNLLPNLLQGILNVMSNSFNLFKNIGYDMFNMVWEGMKDIWSSITGWIEEKVSWLADKLAFWKKGQSEMSGGSSGGSSNSPNKGNGFVANQTKSKDIDANKDTLAKYAKKNNLNYDNGTLYEMWKSDGAPKLARGGIVDQPTLAMVGERGKEAVIPFENSGFLEALTGSIVNALVQMLPLFGGQDSNESNDSKELVLNIEGTPLVRILLPLINNELSRLGYRTLFQTN